MRIEAYNVRGKVLVSATGPLIQGYTLLRTVCAYQSGHSYGVEQSHGLGARTWNSCRAAAALDLRMRDLPQCVSALFRATHVRQNGVAEAQWLAERLVRRTGLFSGPSSRRVPLRTPAHAACVTAGRDGYPSDTADRGDPGHADRGGEGVGQPTGVLAGPLAARSLFRLCRLAVLRGRRQRASPPSVVF